ncbi:MAG TPA: spermidine/putrescine ABC transporter substrate-binding protein [Candidatus Limnocylindrales bacterium]|nr:spermidine/putrescine ABC transporter substrate-binding protein [Candidatus Limnocylindrales bacterium]
MTDLDQRLRALPLTRRVFLQGSSMAGVAAFLAACGGGSTPSPTGQASVTPSEGATAEPTEAVIEGPLNFANWPAYMDLNADETAWPTIDDFEATHGIEVNYVEEIEANEDFYATIAPQLGAGLDSGWDLIVLTDYMAARVVRAGWTEEISAEGTPTAHANVRDELRGLDWDPDMKFHFPWQSGATGVGYNVVSTGRDLTKVEDLFDPAFKGKATMLSGYSDTFSLVGLMLKAKGEIEHVPAEMTFEEAQVVHDYIKPYVDDGHIRAFTGNEYLQDFGSGDTWVAFVWSGDLASSGGPDDRFVFPEEGSIIWTDNMLIPKGAQHKAAAEAMIDFVYDVENAARLALYIYYISPVKGVGDEIAKTDPELGDNPLLFPPAEIAAKMYPQPALSDEEDVKWADLSADLEGA